MATKEIPGVIVTMKANQTSLKYDSTEANGHALADGNVALMISANDEVAPTLDGSQVIGKLIQVSKDGYASVMVSGANLGFVQGAASGCVIGNPIVGAVGDTRGGSAGGYVRTGTSADTSTGREDQLRGRGVVTDVPATTKNTVIRVTLP